MKDLGKPGRLGELQEPKQARCAGPRRSARNVGAPVPGRRRSRVLEINVGIVQGKNEWMAPGAKMPGQPSGARGQYERGKKTKRPHGLQSLQVRGNERPRANPSRYTPPVHLILFDIDGTLIRGAGMGRRALERAFGEVFDVRVDEYPEVQNVAFGGFTDPRILADMSRALGIETHRFQAHRSQFEESYFRHLRVTVAQTSDKKLCPGIGELVPRLSRNPALLLGLLTGNLERGARIKLDPFGLNSYFAFGGFGSDHEDRPTLAARAFELARARSGHDILPEHVLVIGDTEHDIACGRQNDFVTVGVTTGFGSRESMASAGAHAIFETLAPEHGFETWLRERWNLEAVMESEAT